MAPNSPYVDVTSVRSFSKWCARASTRVISFEKIETRYPKLLPACNTYTACVHCPYEKSIPFDESVQPAQQLQQLVASAAEGRNTAGSVPGWTAVPTGAPLILLNGHVCALSSETPITEHRGKERHGFQLREPYQWESDEEAAGFLLPQWMWSVVGGETVSKKLRSTCKRATRGAIVFCVVDASAPSWRTN